MSLDNSEIKVSGVQLLNLKKNSDPRGNLLAFENDKALPFKVKRIFIVEGVPENEVRGIHAHRECWQFLVAVAGCITVGFDDGANAQELVLDRNDVGLLLPPLTYGRQFNFSPDAVLLVLASHSYDLTDYIDDYEEFLQIRGKGN
ncbi:MAG: sugar 3,4-ketoisomerase [Candidatus Nanopelagicales bacterium]